VRVSVTEVSQPGLEDGKTARRSSRVKKHTSQLTGEPGAAYWLSGGLPGLLQMPRSSRITDDSFCAT
jgi:hypothetical protein